MMNEARDRNTPAEEFWLPGLVSFKSSFDFFVSRVQSEWKFAASRPLHTSKEVFTHERMMVFGNALAHLDSLLRTNKEWLDSQTTEAVITWLERARTLGREYKEFRVRDESALVGATELIESLSFVQRLIDSRIHEWKVIEKTT